ncbi:MAG: GTP 3',8-cyclase MoaA [Bowdeniella nasicola]|nr:GTP 3',8-cyclase MoaA [Bowdeniella nasicola]
MSGLLGDAPTRPASEGVRELRDAYGRVARDLRVSLTDRCNLRCTYCMPAEGLDWLPRESTLTDEEVVRLVRIAVEDLGIDEVRFTGGEPLLRRGLEGILAECARLRTRHGHAPELSLTTNGLGLDKRARALKEAGLTRVNVSLDTLDRERYARLARRDRLPDVIAGLAGAASAGLTPIKVNTVLMRGVNEEDAVPLLHFCLTHGYQLRFIEQMPLGPPHTWRRTEMVDAAEIHRRLSEHFALSQEPAPQGSAPAAVWQVAAGEDHPAGSVGIIASVSRPFCGACDRTRLTADGQIRTCLFSRSETDLRDAMRSGASDRELADIWIGAMAEKKAGHDIDDVSFIQPDRTMSAIGG